MEERGPFVSAVNYLFKPETGEKLGSLYLFLSQLARHSQNIEKDSTVSLLVVETDAGIPLPERKRATVKGKAKIVASEPEKKLLESLYRRQFPFSEIFFSLPDFRFYQIEPQKVHWIAGFGKIQDLEPAG